MTLNELEIAISVEITNLNAAKYYDRCDVCVAATQVEALEWVLGLIRYNDHTRGGDAAFTNNNGE